MNICFLIDNSITMIQKAYNGLTLLQMVKSYVQKIMQTRGFGRMVGNQYPNYHLFVSSSNTPLSSYEHQQLHFTNQLKFIKQNPITDLASTIKQVFKQISKYRLSFGCQSLIGNIEPFKSRPTLLIILTDSSDLQTLGTISNKIKNGELKCQYDCQTYFVRICPPSFYDKPSYEGIRKSVENDQSSTLMKQISQYWNGKYFHIHRYEFGFEVIDNIIGCFSPKIFIKLEIIDKSPLVVNYRESGISQVQKAKDTLFLNKNQFIISYTHRNSIRKSRIPLPVNPPKVNNNHFNGTIQFDDYSLPFYTIDVSKAFDFPMSEFMPFQKLELEPSQLSCILQQKLQRLRIEKLYIPVYFNFDQRPISIGLIKISYNKPLQFLYYLANFIQFNPIFQFMLERKSYDKLSMNSFQAAVQEYIRKIPPVYDNYVYQLIFNRGYKVDIRNRVSDQILKQQQQMQISQYKERKIEGQKLNNNIKTHQKFMSDCCPVYSSFYEQWSKQHVVVHNQDEVEAEINKTMYKLLQLKKQLLPHIDDDIQLPNLKVKPITLELNSYSLKAGGNQNQPLGNPYKKKKKIDQININDPPINADPVILKQKIEIQQNNIQLQETKIKESDIMVEEQTNIEKDSSSIMEEKSVEICKEQPYVSYFLSHFIVKKPIELKMNIQNMCNQQYQINKKILQLNGIFEHSQNNKQKQIKNRLI